LDKAKDFFDCLGGVVYGSWFKVKSEKWKVKSEEWKVKSGKWKVKS